jgi:hypothetical protein
LAQSSPQAQAATTNLFAAQAKQLGVNKCADVYAALGQGLTFGAAHAVHTETSETAPDAHVVEGVVGLTYDLPDLKGQAAGVVTAAPVGDSCEGHFVRVAPFQKSCGEVASFLPQGSVPVTDLAGVPLYNLGSGQGRALLVPSGESCIVVSVAQGSQSP